MNELESVNKKSKGGRKVYKEERAVQELLRKSAEYLVMNFHKFDENKKVKIALELIKRRVPDLKEGSGETIVINNFEKKVRELSTDEIKQIIGGFKNRVAESV